MRRFYCRFTGKYFDKLGSRPTYICRCNIQRIGKPRYGGEKCLRVSIHPDIWACGNMSNIFENVEASRQKELTPVCTENPVTIQHVKVDY